MKISLYYYSAYLKHAEGRSCLYYSFKVLATTHYDTDEGSNHILGKKQVFLLFMLCTFRAKPPPG